MLRLSSFRLRSSSLGLRPSGCDPTKGQDKSQGKLDSDQSSILVTYRCLYNPEPLTRNL